MREEGRLLCVPVLASRLSGQKRGGEGWEGGSEGEGEGGGGGGPKKRGAGERSTKGYR